MSNLPPKANWSKVRGVLAEMGLTVVGGKVKREKAIAVIQLASASEAMTAEAGVAGKAFSDSPEVDIVVRRITDAEREAYL